jgi:hypothetical protein
MHTAGNAPKGVLTHRGDAASFDAAQRSSTRVPAVAAAAVLDEEYIDYLVSNRVYRWHKETGPYPTRQASGWAPPATSTTSKSAN